jgi:hypothetical protein
VLPSCMLCCCCTGSLSRLPFHAWRQVCDSRQADAELCHCRHATASFTQLHGSLHHLGMLLLHCLVVAAPPCHSQVAHH